MTTHSPSPTEAPQNVTGIEQVTLFDAASYPGRTVGEVVAEELLSLPNTPITERTRVAIDDGTQLSLDEAVAEQAVIAAEHAKALSGGNKIFSPGRHSKLKTAPDVREMRIAKAVDSSEKQARQSATNAAAIAGIKEQLAARKSR